MENETDLENSFRCDDKPRRSITRIHCTRRLAFSERRNQIRSTQSSNNIKHPFFPHLHLRLGWWSKCSSSKHRRSIQEIGLSSLWSIPREFVSFFRIMNWPSVRVNFVQVRENPLFTFSIDWRMMLSRRLTSIGICQFLLSLLSPILTLGPAFLDRRNPQRCPMQMMSIPKTTKTKSTWTRSMKKCSTKWIDRSVCRCRLIDCLRMSMEMNTKKMKRS